MDIDSSWDVSSPVIRESRDPTVQLVVDHILQPLQPLEDRLPVHQVGNFAIPGSQPLVRKASDLDELLGAVLDPAVDWEQDNPHEHQDVDGQQSFDFACHSHERRVESRLTRVKPPSSCLRARWPALPPYWGGGGGREGCCSGEGEKVNWYRGILGRLWLRGSAVVHGSGGGWFDPSLRQQPTCPWILWQDTGPQTAPDAVSSKCERVVVKQAAPVK